MFRCETDQTEQMMRQFSESGHWFEFDIVAQCPTATKQRSTAPFIIFRCLCVCEPVLDQRNAAINI